jgi:hypothetical protein
MADALRTPVALMLFARPDTTARLLELVRAARPPLVLAVADGPRKGVPGEAGLCAETRRLVAEADWGCEVRTDFADENLGLRRRLESGLDWVFAQVEEAIVLEDDCIPDPTFFRFCDELLERFRHEPRVLSIAGGCFHPGSAHGPSYRFSRYQHIWGWATWRRAWRHYDPLVARWPELRAGGWLEDVLADPLAVQYWTWAFEQAHRPESPAWDWAWQHAAWLAGGLCVVPTRNLVANVGFRADATNTRPERHDERLTPPAVPMDFPLRHPGAVVRDEEADRRVEELVFGGNIDRLLRRLHARRTASPEVGG